MYRLITKKLTNLLETNVVVEVLVSFIISIEVSPNGNRLEVQLQKFNIKMIFFNYL